MAPVDVLGGAAAQQLRAGAQGNKKNDCKCHNLRVLTTVGEGDGRLRPLQQQRTPDDGQGDTEPPFEIPPYSHEKEFRVAARVLLHYTVRMAVQAEELRVGAYGEPACRSRRCGRYCNILLNVPLAPNPIPPNVNMPTLAERWAEVRAHLGMLGLPLRTSSVSMPTAQ